MEKTFYSLRMKMNRALSAPKEMLCRLQIKTWVKTRQILSDTRGMSTLEKFMLLGLMTIILAATVIVIVPIITQWWNSRIVPQFPTS